MSVKDTIKNKIKEQRLLLELNQEELGKRLNVSKQTISGWENGYRTPDLDMIDKLSNFFGCTTDYLLGKTDDPNTEVVNITYGDKPLTFKLAKGTKKELSQEDIQKMIDKLETAGIDMETFIEKLKES